MDSIRIPYSLYEDMKCSYEKLSTSSNYSRLLRVEDVQEILGIGRNSAYALVKSGRLRSIRVGRSIRITRGELARFMGEKYVSSD